MSVQRPVFRIVRNGYDRFMVDDAIDSYTAQIDALQQKVEVYQQQLSSNAEQLQALREKLDTLEKEEQAKKSANDHLARVSLREANEIIATAHRNADEIIRDALSTANEVMTRLTELYGKSEKMKKQMRKQLEDLQKQVDDFNLPEMPDQSWLDETEKKLH